MTMVICKNIIMLEHLFWKKDINNLKARKQIKQETDKTSLFKVEKGREKVMEETMEESQIGKTYTLKTYIQETTD